MSADSLAIRLRPEAQRSIAFGSISGAYTGIGAAYEHPVRLYVIQNLTDATLQFSWDGVVDHFILAAGGSFAVDVTSNKTGTGQALSIAQGDRTYVKTLGTPSSGNVYLSIFYGSNN